MQNLLKQIEKFWAKETRHKDEQSLLKSLQDQQSASELEEHLRSEFEQAVLHSSDQPTGPLSKNQQKAVWRRLKNTEEIKNATDKQGSSTRGRIYSILLPIAACLALAIGGGIYYYQWTGRAARQQLAGNMPARPSAQMVTLANTTANDKTLMLPDHSTVVLAPESQICFPDGFTPHARAIALKGKAQFKVTRDPRRPFTVTAAGLSTTALGTEFIVDSRKETVFIQLLEGKIAVAPTHASSIQMQTVYLNPGEELRVNPKTSYYWSGKTAPKKAKKEGAEPRPGNTDHLVGLSFNKSGLETVFATLSRQYHTKIIYDISVVRGLSFTGSFERSDSLEVALGIVCSINGLTCEKKGEGFVIHQ